MVEFTAAEEVVFKNDLAALIPKMRAFARGLCKDATLADDIAQDALAKAWARRHSFAFGTNLKAWVFMIERNCFYSLNRRSWRSCELDQEKAETTLVAVTDPSSGLELNDVRRAMSMLSAEQQEALVLVGAAGLSYEDVAEICGVAVGTIKSRVSRARARLIELLADGDLVDDRMPAGQAMATIFAEAERLQRAA